MVISDDDIEVLLEKCRSKSKTPDIALIRKAFVTFIKSNFVTPDKTIADFLNIDRSTIGYYCSNSKRQRKDKTLITPYYTKIYDAIAASNLDEYYFKFVVEKVK